MNFKQVTSLEEAEKIVKSSPFLSWDGWNIVYSRPDKNAFSKLSGVYQNGRWCNRTVIEPDRNGWSIPLDFIRK